MQPLSQPTPNPWDLTLLQILQQSPNPNYYAIALARSRQQSMSPTLHLQLAKSVKYDEKWLEVVRRVVEKDYNKAYQCCREDQMMLRPLMMVFFGIGDECGHYLEHSAHYYAKIISTLKMGHLSPSEYLTSINNLQLFLQLSSKHHQPQILQQLLKSLCSQISILCTIFNQIDQANNNIKRNQENFQYKWEIHSNGIKLLKDILSIVDIVEKFTVRKLSVGQFHTFISNGNPSMLKLISIYTISAIELLSTITLQQNKDLQFANIRHINPSILTLLRTQRKQKCIDYYTELCHIVNIASRISVLQLSLMQNQRVLTLLVSTTKTLNIFTLNNYSDLSTQILAINDQISSQTYSDTLAGTYMHMLINLCNNIGLFFKLYLHMLNTVYREENMSQLKTQQFITYLLKVILMADGKLLEGRKEDIETLLGIVNKAVGGCWNSCDQLGRLQVLRYFMAFAGVIGNSRSMADSAEQLLSKCIILCFQTLSASTSYKGQPSHIQQNCLNILQILPQQASTLPILKKSLLPTIINQFTQLINPSSNILQLFHTYLIKIPEIIERSSQFIIQYLYNVFIGLGQSTNLGKIHANIEKTVKIIRILCTILETSSQLRFEDIEQKIVEPILTKLCHPETIEYQEELLTMLELLLAKHAHLTPNVCLVISKLPQLYEKNQKKLSILRNIYKIVANSNQIRNQILYEYPDIINIMLTMFVDYTETVLSVQEFLYYTEEIRNLIWSFQMFLNKFGEYILEDRLLIEMVGVRMHDSLGKCIHQAQSFLQQYNRSHQHSASSSYSKVYLQFQQLLLQLTFTIAHLYISPLAQPLNKTLIPSTLKLINPQNSPFYLYLETIRMIPIIIIDQLFIHGENHESIMVELVKYCDFMGKLEMEWGIGRDWGVVDGVGEWDLWPGNAREYVENVLREMRNRKIIDQVDHAQYTQTIKKVLT